MADDAVGVLDAREIDRAHVHGISLGGMIAQELAPRHPTRVHRLVLGATTPGGAAAVAADPAVFDVFAQRATMSAEDAVRASVEFSCAARTRERHPERISEDIVERLPYPIEPDPYRAQLAAALAHDIGDRLQHIHAATLIIHGIEDRMVPFENAEALAAGIRQPELELLSDAAHLYPTDDLHADGRVAAFLNAG
jgi:pimeloyl-ACP methyl ester carboxylesterase